MATGICDTGKTRLSFADTRRSCRLDPGGQGLGNVETSPIGFVNNGQLVDGFLPAHVTRDKCASVHRKPACKPC